MKFYLLLNHAQATNNSFMYINSIKVVKMVKNMKYVFYQNLDKLKHFKKAHILDTLDWMA